MSDHRRDALTVLLAGFEGPDLPDWLPDLAAQGLGGICLYGNNVAPERDLRDLALAVRALRPDLIIGVDEEGGDVTRFHVDTGSPVVGAAALGHYDDPEVTRAVAAGIGAELAAAGITVTFAPCADVNVDPRNPVIGTRSFGSDPQQVARHVTATVQGLHQAGIAACAKHFPGHGNTAHDSHLALPVVDASYAEITAEALPPFAAAIAAGVPAVMTSHILLPQLDAQHPATMSPAVLTGLLRGALGFDGLIVTDALDMAGASGGLGLGEAAVRALAAGADLLCLGPQIGPHPTAIRSTVAAIVEAVDQGRLDAHRLTAAARQVREFADRWPGRPPADDSAIETARRVSARVARAVVDALPPDPDRRFLHLDTGANAAIGATAWAVPAAESSLLRAADLDGRPIPEGPVALVTRGATRDSAVWAWVQATLEGNPQAWLVETAWPDPQVLGRERTILTWGSSRPQLAAVLSEPEASA